MINKNSTIAIIMSNQQEADLFARCWGQLGYRKITAFTATEEAYQFLVRHQFEVLVTKMEMPQMSGIVFLQKLRETGNYGLEVNLFVCDKLDASLSNLLFELDINHVVVCR